MMLKLNGGRTVAGILRGFDPFMNVVIDESVEECRDGTRNNIGMVVSRVFYSLIVCNRFSYVDQFAGNSRQQYRIGGSLGPGGLVDKNSYSRVYHLEGEV